MTVGVVHIEGIIHEYYCPLALRLDCNQAKGRKITIILGRISCIFKMGMGVGESGSRLLENSLSQFSYDFLKVQGLSCESEL